MNTHRTDSYQASLAKPPLHDSSNGEAGLTPDLSRFECQVDDDKCGDAQMSTWLCAIVFNAAHEYVRKQRGKVFVSLHSRHYRESDGEELEIRDSSLNPEKDFVRTEEHTLLLTAAQKLNPWQLNLLEMCVFEEFSYVRVASILNVSVSSIKSRGFRCRRILKLEISALGGFRR